MENALSTGVKPPHFKSHLHASLGYSLILSICLSQKYKSKWLRRICSLNPTPIRCWTDKNLKSYETLLELLKELEHIIFSCNLLERCIFSLQKLHLSAPIYRIFLQWRAADSSEKTHSEIFPSPQYSCLNISKGNKITLGRYEIVQFFI